MKVSDFIFRFPTRGIGRKDAICRVRIFVGEDSCTYAVLSDLADMNTGSSVTNSVEVIREKLVERGLAGDHAQVVEHYDQNTMGGQTFDWVTFDNNNHPHWGNTDLLTIRQRLGCSGDEFGKPTLEVDWIYKEVQRVRHEIDPHINEPWPESFDVINRREDIRQHKIPLKRIRDQVHRGATETEIQKLLEEDLSILGDCYAYPKEEYVVIPQFPVGDGYVDFAVLSGRSRMDITLVEIKGADYKLVTGTRYEDFSAKTNQAVQQIRKRLGFVTRNYHTFRKRSHMAREAAEAAPDNTGSLVGPKGSLGVSPEKDVNLHAVVIGGRSVDDMKESRLRHEYELCNSPVIRIESWDSWINKVRE